VRVIVLNGVNLNILGRRDPELYGGLTIAELESRIYEWGRELELAVQCRQTNSESEFIKWCHDAHDNTDGIVVNPGAWTHYAWSIHDALEPLEVPIVEVHLSNAARPSSPTSSPPGSSGRAPTATARRSHT
jgi:3-dehydroquinate dehydratase-2